MLINYNGEQVTHQDSQDRRHHLSTWNPRAPHHTPRHLSPGNMSTTPTELPHHHSPRRITTHQPPTSSRKPMSSETDFPKGRGFPAGVERPSRTPWLPSPMNNATADYLLFTPLDANGQLLGIASPRPPETSPAHAS